MLPIFPSPQGARANSHLSTEILSRLATRLEAGDQLSPLLSVTPDLSLRIRLV
jgi:hypothetical protein